jgi:membrane protein DedA with SNARE-associated domain
MEQALGHLIAQYGCAAVLVLVMIEDFGAPAPGETALIAASAAAASGKLNIWCVVTAALIGAVIGDNIGFAIGRFGGRRLVVRLGSRVGLSDQSLSRAEASFKRFGGFLVVGARFVEVLRQLNGIVAGIAGMEWRRFLALNTLGALLWVGVWSAVGYLGGRSIPLVRGMAGRFGWLVLGALIIGMLAYLEIRRLSGSREDPPR